jgi:hypothetical protein
MVFNDTTNKNGMIQDMEMLLNFPDGGISGDSTLLKQVTGLVNQAYLKTTAYVMGLDPKWVWDDFNLTDHPIATADLVSNQEDYTLPGRYDGANGSTLMKLLKVSILDTSGIEVVLQHTDMSEADLNRLYTTGSIPAYYKLIGNSIKLFPKPLTGSVTLNEGLKVYFQRSPDPFTSADTTQQPGIPEPFHRMITLEAAMDYASARGLPNLEYLQGKLSELKTILDEFFTRNKDVRPRIIARRERYT